MGMKDRLKQYRETLAKNLQKEGNEELSKDLTEGNKHFLQIEKDLAAYDIMATKTLPQNKGDNYSEGMQKLIKRVEESAKKVTDDADRALTREKNKNAKSQIYRYLKVFVADINSLVPSLAQAVKYDYESQRASKEDFRKVEHEAERKMRSVLTSLRQLGTGLEAGIAHAARFCKTVNANPTPTEWNHVASDEGVRKLSQPLGNIVKYCYTSLKELDEYSNSLGRNYSQTSEVDVAMNPIINAQIKRLKSFLKDEEKTITSLGDKKKGKTAFDGSIAFLGSDEKAKLDESATREEVLKAVKHLHNMLKDLVPIATKLKQFDAFKD